jgi:hypothetical protein
MLNWEGNKMRLQLDLEDALTDIAKSSGKRCDSATPRHDITVVHL